MEKEIKIKSRDFWFKVVEMLQQNWALIDKSDKVVRVYFISDTSGVFDELEFENHLIAESGLKKNGFSKYNEDKEAQNFIALPKGPFFKSKHPNGEIYSSGRYWI